MDGSKEERGAIKKTEKRIMAARVKWAVDRIGWKKTNKKEKSDCVNGATLEVPCYHLTVNGRDYNTITVMYHLNPCWVCTVNKQK